MNCSMQLRNECKAACARFAAMSGALLVTHIPNAFGKSIEPKAGPCDKLAGCDGHIC